MRISFNPNINFGKRTNLSDTTEKVSEKHYKESEEDWNGRTFYTIKDKKTDKLVQTTLYDDNGNIWIVTNFENGLPSKRAVFNPQGDMMLYRKYNNGISDLLRVVNNDNSLGIPIENEDSELMQEYFERD